ncbi:MAG: glycoside hydrolase family 3 N-terminal domain-containing protein [Actinomycetota bacterium]|nr:glycoside hydrolase family 3 N-terminal domain-containing protein [Actinomycetota bacterium]MEC9058865.1 glycoside hydrolase family 3 N-terminal domain-containing protein [Actinomycetota bacterium]MED5362472.1 glycoside hydrolase family 3 N-terminal domain-containing protein [Actinomycetota bacterium]MEE3257283.1 glycoside hydrolase family 3 N-terminal domain-containing protein [Actinomycetota bacterium]
MIKRTRRRSRASHFLAASAIIFFLAPQGTGHLAAQTPIQPLTPDSTVVAVLDGPGGIGYWIVSVDGTVEVVGTNIIPPLGESEPLTDKVRTAYEGAPGALGIWLELVNGTKVAIGDPGPRIFTGHERPSGWLSGLAVKQLMRGRWIDTIDRGCVAELPRAVRIGQLLLPTMEESQFGAAVEEARDHQIAGILLSGGATPWIGRRVDELQEFANRIPLLMAADEEGGRVQRLHHILPDLPSPARQVNERLEIVAQRAERHAIRMLEFGFDVNFAPVLDVGAGPGIGDRSFSNDPALVVDYGVATIEGFSDGGVLTVAKHFPGHGSADFDSHDGRSVGPPLHELIKTDLVPFEAAIATGKSAIMVGHTEIPEVTNGLPSSLSSAAVQGLLRDDLGFEGLVVTDALNMKAVSDRWSIEEAVVMALGAGADLMVLGSLADVGAAFAGIDEAVYEGQLAVDRVNDAAINVLRAKKVNACTLVGRVRGVFNTVYDW